MATQRIFSKENSVGESARYGFVYLLANDAMPGLYKIGVTAGSPHARAKELSSTSAPMPFHVLCYAEHEIPYEHESLLHSKFSEFRVNDRREFFRFDPDQLGVVASWIGEGALSFAWVDFEPHLFEVRNPNCRGEATL